MPAVATAAGLPSRLGKYELLLPLAAGGMARIYIGRSTGIGSFERHVVLKMITPERANDLTAVNMFLDEARLAASLNHQNVAQVFEVGEDAGIHYLAMEYVHGQDLRAVLAKAGSQGTRIPLELALTVVAGAAAGLHHAHERRGPDGVPLGIVHRDVSPSNIMIGYDGAVKLLDFGIAKATARSVETQSGIIKGKFAYMAPEQCRGRDVDRRSDVFSLGIILYEISTQHRCFRADSDFDTMHRIVTGDVVRPTRLVHGYPQALEAIVMKALAIDAAQRYQSAGLLLEALESFAVSARMSLSTMGLGRFMRDMFGDVQEPWLNTAATKVLQPIAAKENTISSTDGKGSTSSPIIVRDPAVEADLSAIPDDEAAFPDSSKAEAAKTILDLPRDPREAREPDAHAEYNPKSYPASLPSVASKETLPPDAQLRPVYPLEMVPPAGLSMPAEMKTLPSLPPADMKLEPELQPLVRPPGGTRQMSDPQGMQLAPHSLPHNLPLQPPPAHAFSQTPGSASAPALPPIVSTKHGYASAAMTSGDVSYPRYEAPSDATPAVQLTPNRRPLFIGLGIVAVGVIALLAVAFSGGDEERALAGSDDDSQEQATPTEMPVVTAEQPAGTADEAIEDMVSVVIDSDPKGADVLIAGTKIGVTPFESKLKRGTKVAQLTVQKAGYAPFNTKIDLGGDYENRRIKLASPENEKGSNAVPAPDKGTPKTGATEQPAEKSGTEKAGTTEKTTEKSSTQKAGATDKTTERTTDRTGTAKSGMGNKAGTTKTGDRTGATEKTSTGDKGGTSAKTPPPPKKEKCQPPGPNVDPFGPPICKS